MATRADKHTDRPSSMDPGDAPHDTTDPGEHVTSVLGDKAASGRAGFGTVNAAVKIDRPAAAAPRRGKDRTETYEATTPDGSTVTVTRNIETGESKVGS